MKAASFQRIKLGGESCLRSVSCEFGSRSLIAKQRLFCTKKLATTLTSEIKTQNLSLSIGGQTHLLKLQADLRSSSPLFDSAIPKFSSSFSR
jgi:hypothetical protein